MCGMMQLLYFFRWQIDCLQLVMSLLYAKCSDRQDGKRYYQFAPCSGHDRQTGRMTGNCGRPSGIAKSVEGARPPIFQTKHKHTFKLREIGQFGQFKIIKIVVTRSFLKVKMHQIWFRLGLYPTLRWGSLQRSPSIASRHTAARRFVADVGGGVQ